MATRSNSNEANRPISYTVVFVTTLTGPQEFSSINTNGNQTAATMAAQCSTFIPASPFEGCQGRQLKHGDQFTSYDDEAYYLKAKYVKSVSNPYGVLTVVSETL